MNDIIDKIILNKEEIDFLNKKIAKYVNDNYENKKPIIIGLLEGCNPFLNDVLKYINIEYDLCYIKASSYLGTKSQGHVNISNIPSVNNRDVIIFDDIIDTGNTLYQVSNKLKENNALRIKMWLLLDKYKNRIVDIQADMVGIKIDSDFVIGYGLDYNGLYRDLPYIGILKKEIYE